MPGASPLNLPVLRAVALAFYGRSKLAVEVGVQGQRRVLFFDGGHLVAATSESLEDRLGQQLVREGRIDSALLEPVQHAAKQAGRLFGNQLLAEGLLRPDELAAALERQVVYRFQCALVLEGPVVSDIRPGPGAVVRQPIGALVVDFFRTAEEAQASTITSRINWELVRLRITPDELDPLRLKPPELRVARMLAAGRGTEVASAGSSALRLAAALGALGLLGVK